MKYSPLQPGIQKKQHADVFYREYPAGTELAEVVYCFWELRTKQVLSEALLYAIVPDACVDLVWNLESPRIDLAYVMTPGTSQMILNLGKQFWYMGVRFLPGRVQEACGRRLEEIIASGGIQTQSLYSIPLYVNDLNTAQQEIVNIVARISERMKKLNNLDLYKMIDELILGSTVGKIALKYQISERTVNRLMKKYVGFLPLELQGIAKWQRAIQSKDSYLEVYVDQAHYIKHFKKVTGLTPRVFRDTYAMSEKYNT